MSNEESKNDVVKEARELLETHSIVAMRVDKPYKEIRPLISALCDEVEELRRRNETQADSITEFQEEQKSFRALLRDCLPYVLSSAEASRMVDGFEPQEHAEDRLAQRMFDAIGDEELREQMTPPVVKKLRGKRTN